MVSVLENTGDEDRLKRTYLARGSEYIFELMQGSHFTYLRGNVSNRWKCYTSHSVNAGVPRSGGLGLFFDRARRGENVLEGLK